MVYHVCYVYDAMYTILFIYVNANWACICLLSFGGACADRVIELADPSVHSGMCFPNNIRPAMTQWYNEGRLSMGWYLYDR